MTERSSTPDPRGLPNDIKIEADTRDAFLESLCNTIYTKARQTEKREGRNLNNPPSTPKPSWAGVVLEGPQSAEPGPSTVQHDITRLVFGRAPNMVGPVLCLLLTIDNLHQVVSADPNLARIARLSSADMDELRQRLLHGSRRVTWTLGYLLDRERLDDVLNLLKGLQLLESCLETITDESLKLAVEDIAKNWELGPESPILEDSDTDDV